MADYWSSTFLLPKGIIKDIDQRCKRFLWKGKGDRGAAKVAWEQVCRPVVAGGLGIRALWPMNRALICKHLWNVLTDNPDSIWVQRIKEYRLQNHSIWTARATTGDGSKFWLWLDPWHPNGVLLHSYPRGPMLTRFARNNKPQTTIVEKSMASGRFSTQSAYRMMTIASQPIPWHTLIAGPWKISRNTFILWLTVQQKLSTMDKPWLVHQNGICMLYDKSSYFGHTLIGLLASYGHQGGGEGNTLSMLLIDNFLEAWYITFGKKGTIGDYSGPKHCGSSGY
ncbi:hypothetical protein Sango_2832000 [Sesamum angolense]|uniref:Reverse transcriptase zinc-binding domain-containing protein n=1 Tax=Sesamum angolense TaxID=2727404 RepID=A0AAE1T785_9LAMI|nr:hypothetical protein Sango_2832000 [Sesamum angolense]